MELDNSIQDPESPELRDVSAAPNVPALIWPTLKSKRQGEKELVTDDEIKTKQNKAVTKMYNRNRQCFTSFFMYLDGVF
jgi:hypothetical protein